MVFIREEAADRRGRAQHCGERYGHEQNHHPSGAARRQRAQALVQKRASVQALMMNHDGSLWRTPGMAELLQTA